MSGKTLVVSRNYLLFPHYKKRFKQLGFGDIEITDEDKDALSFRINDVKPRLLIVSCSFYQAGTPYMMCRLHELFPNLNIAVVALHDYPLSLAPWFIFHGVKSYLNMLEGYEEFHRGLQIVSEGGEYISPRVKEIIDSFDEWPNVKNKLTRRQYECLVMLCCGLEMKSIGNALHLSVRSAFSLKASLSDTFHVSKREELVALAWGLDLVTKNEIIFYDHKRDKKKIPDWAKIQIEVNKKFKALDFRRYKRVESRIRRNIALERRFSTQ
jgi:DNA-binding NarL/FixJ family response regulator